MRIFLALVVAALVEFPASPFTSAVPAADEPVETGPATEKRFPPLELPPGFRATLFACDPLIEYPSVIALGPQPGSLFVAQDDMTGLGYNSPRRSEIKLVADTDGDGYADTTTLFAGDFNSLQGLAGHEGTVYAMHAPLLTALRDTDGDGRADVRTDLLSGLGLSPKDNPNLLHCANGVVPGHDGWLYLAVGDRGCDVRRPEGDRFVLKGGGILRCRGDGRDLHLFAGGLRNIYDVALDEELNVFVRDNENDGGNYMIRVYHSFFGADHGYPYLYDERPDEGLRPLADLGRGSSAGGVCYLETAFPPAYRGSLFFCEWGRALVRYERQRAGGTFAPMQEFDFAAGGPTDPYGLKPTDVIVDRDGSLLMSDWGDGQRPKRGRGRVYRITYGGKKAGEPDRSSPRAATRGLWRCASGGSRLPLAGVADPRPIDDWIAQLDSESYYTRSRAQSAIIRQAEQGLAAVRRAFEQNRLGVRGRLHAVWVLAGAKAHGSRPVGYGGRAPADPIDELLTIAGDDPDVRVRAQAIRALADLTDPVLVTHRLDAEPGDANIAARLAELAAGADPRIQLEVIVALGRLRYSDSPAWLADHLQKPDLAFAHAAMQTLRRCGNWSAVLNLLDRSADSAIRPIALRAVADRAEPQIVDGILQRLKDETDADRRREYADFLTRVYKQPGEQPYWGYRPAPRPAGTVAWERTEAIGQALDGVLAVARVRTDVLRRMQREQIPVRLSTLEDWLRSGGEAAGIAAALDSLRDRPAADVRPILWRVVLDRRHAESNRLTALAMFVAGLDSDSENKLLDVANEAEDGAIAAESLRRLGERPNVASSKLLLRKLSSRDAAVRTAAVESLASLKIADAAARVPALLDDSAAEVRRAAASAAGSLEVTAAVPSLLKLARDDDPAIRIASLESLRELQAGGAVAAAVSALEIPAAQPAALAYLRDFGTAEQTEAVLDVARQNRAADVLGPVVRALAKWRETNGDDPQTKRLVSRAIANVQGESGTLLYWSVVSLAAPEDPQPVFAEGTAGTVSLAAKSDRKNETLWQAVTDVLIDQPGEFQFLGSSDGTLAVSVDGRQLFERSSAAAFKIDADRFDAKLDAGLHRLTVAVKSAETPARFHLRFRQKSSTAEHERLIGLALAGRGNVRRGRELFFNVEKSLCMKCHRIGNEGQRIGPDLTGIGSRFSRIHLIESLLQPSRTIAPSYQTQVVVLTSGRVLTGVKAGETDQTLTIADSEGKQNVVRKSEIEAVRTSAKSTMPEEVEKRLSSQEFVDLIAFLLSQKR